jgi:hypothetical protein
MWTLMIAQLLARDTYLYLTPQTNSLSNLI